MSCPKARPMPGGGRMCPCHGLEHTRPSRRATRPAVDTRQLDDAEIAAGLVRALEAIRDATRGAAAPGKVRIVDRRHGRTFSIAAKEADEMSTGLVRALEEISRNLRVNA